jgi:hypothetical protein
MPAHALRARHDEIVVGQHGAWPTVDRRCAAYDPVRRAFDHQLEGVPAALLRGRDEPSVFDEGTVIDEVSDVLPRGPPTLGVPSGDLVGSCLVGGEEPSREDLGQALGGWILS